MDNKPVKLSKFSKDPIVFRFEAEQFFRIHNYLYTTRSSGINWLDEAKEIEICDKYFKFTSKLLVAVEVGVKYTNFGMNEKPKIEMIQVVERNGNEKNILLNKLESLKKHHAEEYRINSLLEVIDKLPEYDSSEPKKKDISFEDCLIDLGYKTTEKWKKEFVVLDLETNGLRCKYDDLLSISIYDPQNGVCYNRYLPLDMQPVVLTTRINGIKQEDLEGFPPLTQEEVNKLIEKFKLNERIVLVYSGGSGTFDSSFLNNYCKRHKLIGLENLQYKNIKDFMPDPGFGFEGKKTKDNYCRLFGIEGVSDIHSGTNDCLLEWKLFEAIAMRKPFFSNGNLFSFSDDYIVPVTALINQPVLRQYKKIDMKVVVGVPTPIYTYKFPKNAIRYIKKFPTNITGITLENALYSLINPSKQDNVDFLLENKLKNSFIGRLGSNIEEIPVVTFDDGTVQSLDEQYDEYIDEVNKVSKKFMSFVGEAVEFIKEKIFHNSKIMSEELVISEDKKILAICDLSSDDAVLEIKTNGVISYGLRSIFDFMHIKPEYAMQLYYESKGRKPYIMSIVFDYTAFGNIGDISIEIYSVELQDKTEEAKSLRPKLWILEEEVLNLIKENENISIAEMARRTQRSTVSIQRSLNVLRNGRYVRREGNRKEGKWIVIPESDLKDNND